MESMRTPKYTRPFWSRVNMTGDNDCWAWKGQLTTSKYGFCRRTVGGIKYWLAHRVAYRLHYGEFDNSLKVLHKCDNPSCCNPNHLFIGTAGDNNRDRNEKQRDASMPGELNGRAKLTWDDVRAIRDAATTASCAQLAAEFGVSKSNIRFILTGDTWREGAISDGVPS